jgi:hypothetical protein
VNKRKQIGESISFPPSLSLSLSLSFSLSCSFSATHSVSSSSSSHSSSSYSDIVQNIDVVIDSPRKGGGGGSNRGQSGLPDVEIFRFPGVLLVA